MGSAAAIGRTGFATMHTCRQSFPSANMSPRDFINMRVLWAREVVKSKTHVATATTPVAFHMSKLLPGNIGPRTLIFRAPVSSLNIVKTRRHHHTLLIPSPCVCSPCAETVSTRFRRVPGLTAQTLKAGPSSTISSSTTSAAGLQFLLKRTSSRIVIRRA